MNENNRLNNLNSNQHLFLGSFLPPLVDCDVVSGFLALLRFLHSGKNDMTLDRSTPPTRHNDTALIRIE